MNKKFNLRLLEKQLEHQLELVHNFIDLRKCSIVSDMMVSCERTQHENQLTERIRSLYDEVTSTVLLNVVSGIRSNDSSSPTRISIISSTIYYILRKDNTDPLFKFDASQCPS